MAKRSEERQGWDFDLLELVGVRSPERLELIDRGDGDGDHVPFLHSEERTASVPGEKMEAEAVALRAEERRLGEALGRK
jgi:hypothetical protein